MPRTKKITRDEFIQNLAKAVAAQKEAADLELVKFVTAELGKDGAYDDLVERLVKVENKLNLLNATKTGYRGL